MGAIQRPLSRRAIVAAPAALLLQRDAGAAATRHPDQPLLEACAAFEATVTRIENCYAGGETPILDESERDRFLAPLLEQESELIGRICTLRAHTDAGCRARAAAVVAWQPDMARGADDEFGRLDKRLIAALLRDLVAAGGRP